MIDLRNAINRKELPKNPNKIVDTVQKILGLGKQQKSKRCPSDLAKRIDIWTPKQMLQRLPIALAPLKPGNTSENLLNEIRQITYFLYWEKEITKKVDDNIMNSNRIWSS